MTITPLNSTALDGNCKSGQQHAAPDGKVTYEEFQQAFANIVTKGGMTAFDGVLAGDNDYNAGINEVLATINANPGLAALVDKDGVNGVTVDELSALSTCGCRIEENALADDLNALFELYSAQYGETKSVPNAQWDEGLKTAPMPVMTGN